MSGEAGRRRRTRRSAASGKVEIRGEKGMVDPGWLSLCRPGRDREVVDARLGGGHGHGVDAVGGCCWGEIERHWCSVSLQHPAFSEIDWRHGEGESVTL